MWRAFRARSMVRVACWTIRTTRGRPSLRGLRAPEVLLNGDHQEIRRWRREQQLRKTLTNRPDLLEQVQLSKDDRKLLESIRRGQ